MKKNKSPFNGYDTYAEVNLRKLRDNFKIIRKVSNKNNPDNNTKICAVVKANAYGHGMCRIAEELVDSGTDYLGTAFITEAVELSDYFRMKRKDPKILCLGTMTDDIDHFADVLEHRFEVTLSDIKTAKSLNKYAASNNRTIDVHVKFDTGMNRTGFLSGDIYEAVVSLLKLKNLNLKGIYSHYSTAEIPGNSHSKEQFKKFKDAVIGIEANLVKFELKHIENSGGILNFRDNFCNMTRPGIMLYGYYPDRSKLKEAIGIEPVMRMISKVSLIKEIPKGEGVSYGRKFITKEKTRIISIPIGYGDGYPRALTNKSKVYIKGKLYPSVGTVCMDWIMADVGMKDSIEQNDKVIIFGHEYSADELAKLINTIPYEIITNVSDRVKRIYV